MKDKTPLHERYWLALAVNKLFSHYQSEHCKMLVEAIKMQDAKMPWMLSNCTESFMRYTINPVDRFVLYAAMRQRAHNKIVSDVLCGIAAGWKDSDDSYQIDAKYQNTIVGGVNGYKNGGLL